MARVTGIGGVFFKAGPDRERLVAWYQRCLGINLEDFGGAVLSWPADQGTDGGLTVWHVADQNSDWFAPSKSAFMINYRIDNMDEMVIQLRREKVDIIQGPESHENGRFVWILDPDGNKVELWEPMAWDEANKDPGDAG